jgi:hypothetical protein
MTRSIVLTVALTLVPGGCLGASEQEGATRGSGEQTTDFLHQASQPEPMQEPCPATRPNGRIPPGETPSSGSRYLGNDALWTDLYPTPIRPRPDDVREGGAIEMKVGWWRGIAGRLRIEGGGSTRPSHRFQRGFQAATAAKAFSRQRSRSRLPGAGRSREASGMGVSPSSA